MWCKVVLLVLVGALSIVTAEETKEVTKCTENGMTLECPDDEIVRIIAARYGAKQGDKSNNNMTCVQEKGDCVRHDAAEVTSECAGRQVCEIFIKTKIIYECDVKSDYIHIQYRCESENHLFNLCDDVERNITSEGVIQSPNYPYAIQPHVEECYCTIHPQSENSSVIFSLVSTHLAGSTMDCKQYLLIGDANRNHHLCGTMDSDIPFQRFFRSSASDIQVSFRNKYAHNHGAFKIVFQAVPQDNWFGNESVHGVDRTPVQVKCGNAVGEATVLPLVYKAPPVTTTLPPTEGTPRPQPSTASDRHTTRHLDTNKKTTTTLKTPAQQEEEVPAGWYSPGQVAGIVIGVLLVIGLVAGITYYVIRRKANNLYIHKFP